MGEICQMYGILLMKMLLNETYFIIDILLLQKPSWANYFYVFKGEVSPKQRCGFGEWKAI